MINAFVFDFEFSRPCADKTGLSRNSKPSPLGEGRSHPLDSRLRRNDDTRKSAAPHRDDDLQPVAVRQLLRGKLAARHDRAVALQGDAFAGQPHLLDERGDADGLRKLAGFAIDADRYHFGVL